MDYGIKTGKKWVGFWETVIMFFLGLLIITTLFPFINCVAQSFNDGNDLMRGGVYFLPRKFTFDNYIEAFKNHYILDAAYVTLVRVVLGTAAGTLLNSITAYALIKKGLPGKALIIFYLYFTNIFRGGIIPDYMVFREFGLVNTIWIYIAPQLFTFYFIILLKTFFETIPDSISESSTIDGCNELQIFYKVYLPLSGPALASIVLFQGVRHWNDWFTGSFYTNVPELKPLATLLEQILKEASFEQFAKTGAAFGTSTTTPESIRMAFVVITILPIVCVYPFLQKFFSKGIMLGAIKG